MKKSVQLIFVLTIVFIITDRLLSSGLMKIDENVLTGQSVGKVNQFLSVKDSVDLLVFGSSRAFHHVNNLKLSASSYNMGSDGSRIGYSAALISTLNKKNQTVLVHIDPEKVFDTSYKGKDILSLENLILRNDTISKFIYDSFPEEIYLTKLFHCYAYNGKVLGMLKNYLSSPTYDKNYTGYEALLPTSEQKKIFKQLVDQRKASNISEEIQSTELNEINPLVVNFIEKIKDVCKKNNSQLIFFTSPTLTPANPNYRFKTDSLFKSKHIKYLDYSNLFDFEELDHWKDFTHMSGLGADKFMDAFKKDLKL